MRRLPILVALLASVALFAGAGCGGDSEPTVAEFQESVVSTRNRVDFALARIPKAESREEFFNRMNEASAAIDGAANDFEEAGAPDEFAPEAEKFASSLRQLAVDIEATAADLQNPALGGVTPGLQGFNFPSWDQANLALATMIGKGIKVDIIGRH